MTTRVVNEVEGRDIYRIGLGGWGEREDGGGGVRTAPGTVGRCSVSPAADDYCQLLVSIQTHYSYNRRSQLALLETDPR